MFGLAEGCRYIEPKFIEDDDLSWEQVLKTLDRWGDRMVPSDKRLWHPMDAHH